jgi:hypothetical protein
LIFLVFPEFVDRADIGQCWRVPQSGRRMCSEGEQRSPEQREGLDGGVVVLMLTPRAPDDGDQG